MSATSTHFESEHDRDDVARLLVRSWLTHDAMWFKNAVELVGIGTANQLNRSAVRDTARIEARRLLGWVGLDSVRSFRELRRLFEAGRELFVGDVIELDWTWSEDEVGLTVEIHRCFAYEGVVRLGVEDRYECGIFERIYGWLEGLGIPVRVEPDVSHCLMHHEGRCFRRLLFTLPDDGPAEVSPD